MLEPESDQELEENEDNETEVKKSRHSSTVPSQILGYNSSEDIENREN